jgi:hypothetical protein
MNKNHKEIIILLLLVLVIFTNVFLIITYEKKIKEMTEFQEEMIAEEISKDEVKEESEVIEEVVEVTEEVIYDVTLEMLETRLQELLIKYEGTTFEERDILVSLAEANHSFMSEETLFQFLDISSYEELQPFIHTQDLYNESMKNLEKKRENVNYELVVFDVGDLFFDETLIETGHFISERILALESEDEEEALQAARDLVFYYSGCMPEGKMVDEAPIKRDDEILVSSASLYINGFYGYAIAILCREEIELEQPDAMEKVCGMWGDYDHTYEFYYLYLYKRK